MAVPARIKTPIEIVGYEVLKQESHAYISVGISNKTNYQGEYK